MKKIIFFYLIALSACMTIPTISSVPESTRVNDDYRYYNAESKVLYKVTHDEKNLHVILNTTEETSILKILRTGLTVYFDVSGKKKKDIFVHYPFKLNSELPKEGEQKEAVDDQSRRTLNYLVSRIPRELVFSAYGTTEKIDLTKAGTDISDSITVIRDKEITYELTIPLNRISKNGTFPLNKLSIGVVSGKFEIPSGNNMDGAKPRTDRSGGVSPGGVGRSPGSEEIPDVKANTVDNDLAALGTPIDFWFRVIFNPKN